MAVRDDFSPGEVLTSSDLNDTFASKLPYSYGTAEPTTTVDGFVWFDENDTPPTPKFWDGSAFVNFPSGAAAAVISSPAATGNYTDGDGVEWNYYTFTTTGTLTVGTEGEVEYLVVAGGGGSGYVSSFIGGGGAGQVLTGAVTLSATSHTITVGAGGSSSSAIGSTGSNSSIGTEVIAGGGGRGVGAQSAAANTPSFRTGYTSGGGHAGGSEVTHTVALGAVGMGSQAGGANAYTGVTSSITGSAVEYGIGGHSGAPTANGSGGWSSTTNGANGVVIVRVKA